MIENILSRKELLGFARKQSRSTDRRTVKPADLEEAKQDGWEIRRRNKRSISMTRVKSRSDLLESRVWTVFYRMGFSLFSGKGGAHIQGKGEGEATKLDVVAIDDEVAVAAQCRSLERPMRDSQFAEKVAKLASTRGRFASAVSRGFRGPNKRHVATTMFVWDLMLSDRDRERAREDGVFIFDKRDLEYFEQLVAHLGPAARYQFLSTVFRGKKIAGLEVTVPALQTKMGGHECFCFSIQPEYLLKIAYVAHRARGKAIDIDAYQRLIKRGRLKKIAEFISSDGIFPTNVVVNIESRRYARFDQGKQRDGGPGGRFGWLTLSPSYGTAWVIDGQHRLFAYSGHEKAKNSYLNVLAFVGLSPSLQTQLFVEINSEQKKVPRSLLVELDSNLKWDAEDEGTRIHAVVSRAGLALDEEDLSPLRERVLLADARRTHTRCVSLASIASALSKPGFFITARTRGVTEYGPLWRDDPSACLRRTVAVISFWLAGVAELASDWWELGSAEGGGVAMNDGVTVCIETLRSVLAHLSRGMERPAFLDDDELISVLRPYATALGNHFARMSAEERVMFRGLRGIEGQTTGRRLAEEALQSEFPEFQPPGLADWIQRRKENTNDEVRKVVEAIEKLLQESILNLLKDEFPGDNSEWFYEGVPNSVRKKVDDRINDQGGGRREESFDLIDYRQIIESNWELCKPMFGYGRANAAKNKQTKWLNEVNEMRKIVMHPSRRDYLSLEKLQMVQKYKDWLEKQLAKGAGGSGSVDSLT